RSTSAKSHEKRRPVTFDTLRAFIDALDGAGELVRITRPVSLDRELCEIADRVMKQSDGGRALLFEHPVLMSGAPSDFPLAINLFGSRQRMAMSLGVTDLDEIGVRITSLLELKVPEGFVAKLALLPKLLEVGRFPPRIRSGTPPCQDVVWLDEDVDIGRIPDRKSTRLNSSHRTISY